MVAKLTLAIACPALIANDQSFDRAIQKLGCKMSF